jgi:hypothetical protein
MSNTRPSRPTRLWRNRIGLPSDAHTATVIAISSGARRASRSAAKTRSNAYLRTNCQLRAFVGSTETSGSEPTNSIPARSFIVSKRRGTTAASMPALWQRRMIASCAWCEAGENATITCSAPC